MAEWKVAEPKEKYGELDTMTDKILKIRGIKDRETFLEPKESDVNSPFALSNMQEAVDKIIKAIKTNSIIGIYCDIDTDGVTSATIMYKYLKNHGINAQLLYHQRKDNHGVIINNVPKDINLLIIVDSSTSSAKECSVLSKTMDIIILDHHESERKNKYAIIVNPQLNDYSNKHLSGAGVVYQTCKAIDQTLLTFYADEYIDICAVGLVGDMMDVTNPETRYLIHKGLIKIQNKCDKNLLAILKKVGKEYKPNATSIAFYLVPFINAIIRLGKIEDALEILTTDDDIRLKALIKACGGKNENRKVLQADIVEEIEKTIDLSHKMIIADVTSINVNKTLNGLIANAIAQKYQKPTIVVSLDTDDNLLKGSGRGYGSKFDFKKVLTDTGLFDSVAGHSGAFGCEILPIKLNDVYAIVDKMLENIEQDMKIEADMVIEVEDISWDLAYEIQALSFIAGTGFKEPIFIIRGLSAENVKVMKEVHLKFNAEDLECVKFNVSLEEIQSVEDSLLIDIVGSISVNAWYNFGTKKTIKTKQVMLKDFIVY